MTRTDIFQVPTNLVRRRRARRFLQKALTERYRVLLDEKGLGKMKLERRMPIDFVEFTIAWDSSELENR